MFVTLKVMVLCEFTLIAALYYNILLWFPYYFTVAGYEEYAAYFSMLGSAPIFVGTLFMEHVLNLCPKQRHWFTMVLLVVTAGVQFWILEVGKQGQSTETIVLLVVLIFC